MEQETTIDLRELLEIIRKRIWIIALVTVLATVVSGIVSFFVLTPIYESSTQLLVNKSENKNDLMMPTANDIQTNLRLIDTYNVIIKSPRILEKAISNMGLDMTASQLGNKINVTAVRDSQVMSITVTDPDPLMAVKIANGIATTFQQEIKTIMSVDNVQILAEAKIAEKPSPVKPKPYLNMAIALVVGLMASVGIVFLLEYLDNTIKTEQDVEQILGLSVLGAIATIDYKSEDKLGTANAKSAAMGGKGIEA
ncbi:YveK family protein [Ammoniphilus resinae]|uniref:Capsular polysaccharide biosynthesis protein n=1 Tax=Ammoniphilus resinae TaxID=861532 RepID=A0ABS4GXG2_9BACL|nr:Wzz/FepE/Etk N-terminal domain-containing protein [Ammoniphilus resinae]MBP1934970.1 capsular polysaccharide biosynthesis protein [Ammoniphilus resinae]